VETLVNWDDVMEVAILGIPPEEIPEEALRDDDSPHIHEFFHDHDL
jgi:hypothetical protein